MKPTVSIVTPSYNQAEFLPFTLQSVKNQDYADVDHVVFDAGSSDGSRKVLAKYEDCYGLSWTSEPDEGHWHAVNKGFDQAGGDVVGWLNSDDAYLHTNTVSKVVEAFEENEDADVVYGNAIEIDKENRVLAAKEVRDFSYRRLLRGCFLIQPAVFFRRHVVEAEKLRPGLEYALDYEYWLRLAQKFEFRRLDDFLAADRVHDARKSTAGADIQREQSEVIRREYGYDGDREWGDIPWADRLWSGIPRSVRAARALLKLRARNDEAFNVCWGRFPTTLLRHSVHSLEGLLDRPART